MLNYSVAELRENTVFSSGGVCPQDGKTQNKYVLNLEKYDKKNLSSQSR